MLGYIHKEEHSVYNKYNCKTDIIPRIGSLSLWLWFADLGTANHWTYKHARKNTETRHYKYVLNLPFLTNVDYKTRLQSLHLLPISYWLEYLDMTFFFKITHGMIETSVVPVIYAAQRATRSSSSNTKYVVPRCKTTTYQQSFIIRACRLWNALVDELNFDTDNNSYFKSY